MINSDDEDFECPLCMEELDIADRNFRPCACGYQICRFCWHHIKENLNGRCPACRREYSDEMVEFEPISADEISRIKREKKEKERQQKDMEAVNRRHLANMRVVQKNLVYVIGLHPKLAVEETVRSHDFFGQFGKISKIVINKRPVVPTTHAGGSTSMQPSAAVYVTYQRKEDAAKAINAVDGSIIVGRILRASYGTTKYCTYYLRNMSCPNPSCLYLHEPGEDADTISKEELATGKHRMRDQLSTYAEEDSPPPPPPAYPSSSLAADFPPVSASTSTRKPVTLESVATISYKTPVRTESAPKQSYLLEHIEDERSALPATASWAKAGSSPSTPILKSGVLPERTLTPDNFGPPLSVAVAAAQKQPQQQSPSVTKRRLEKKKRKEQEKIRAMMDADDTKSDQGQASQSQTDQPVASGETDETETEEAEPPAATVLETPTTKQKSNSGSAIISAVKTGKETPKASSRWPNGNVYDGLVSFVLGDAFDQVCPLFDADQEDEGEEAPVGVSALHDGTFSEDETPATPQGLARNVQSSLETDLDMSPLDFLINSVPTPTYTGTFNPFAHQVLRSTGSLFESPIRKHSRFGFAQI
ncbi:hypothetical protein CLU79DRAFT_755106 [Phycomyces nitens]|nr:hypothetical protein CLU79DRAFT_755106 [Phycomyces nitens]